ncbi:MAG: caspase family protein [Thermoanaerobaculia bacterium]
MSDARPSERHPALHALLVGIDRHRPQRLADGSRIPDLQACVNDVERMEAFLQAPPLSVPPGRIRKLLAPGADPLGGRPEPAPEALPTYRNLVRELEALETRARKGDQVLIHYSGHGARLPTVIPGKKGPAGRDECLVPCDAGEPGSGFVRDVELYEILRRLAGRGVQSTLILDCCHSGGITRELPRGNVRGLGDVSVPARSESLLGAWEELGGTIPQGSDEPEGGDLDVHEPGGDGEASRRERYRHVTFEPGWFPQPDGCVLLAACRPTELAREYAFDGGVWSGALTHFLLQALGDLEGKPTYRWLHHRLLGRIRRMFDSQTPILEGDGELHFLGRRTWPARRGIAVLRVEGDGPERRVELAAGRAQGLRKGARVSLAGPEGPAAPVDPAASTARPELEVTEVGVTTCWAGARWDGAGRRSGLGIEPGDLVELVDPGPGAQPFPVRLLPPEEGPAAHDEWLGCLRQALEDSSRRRLELAFEGGPEREVEAAFQVGIAGRGVLRILDPSGEPVPHLGDPIAVSDPGSVERILERLDHLARFKERERLNNPSTSSPLAGKLRADLYRLGSIDDWEGPVGRRPLPDGACVADGTLLCLLVRNDSTRELNFAVLDLQPDWGVSRVHPGPREGAYSLLEAGTEQAVFLRAGLPDWIREGRDRLKVLAATGPLDVDCLELPALGVAAGVAGARSLRNRGEAPDLIESLFNPTGPSTGFRTMQKVAPGGHEWGVDTVEVLVEKQKTA